MSITHGMDLRRALQIARKLGCSLVYTGGDIKLSHPRGKTHRISAHRNSASRYLTQWLRTVAAI